jgi:hypothetical protein
MKYDAKGEQALMTELWDPAIADDLLKFVLFVYPWGKAGTPLEHFEGPRQWQRDYLDEVTEHLKTQSSRMALDLDPEMWRHGTASGRGPGKSALVAWLTHHMLSTRIGSTTIITANTEPQLKSRTFAEVTKWQTMALNGHWFESTVLSVRPAGWFEALLKKQMQVDTGYYYAQGQLWSEENPDAFAGVHNPHGVRVIYDEASGIPKSIWTVTEGFFTEPTLNRFWDVFSNPRRNSGAFFEVFHDEKTRARWRRRQIDSRTVEGTDRALFNSLIEQHGVDSDEVRVEVLGQFPNTAARQFIGNDIVEQARTRELVTDTGAPLVMGVDISRQGNDFNVVRFRQGPDARSIPAVRWKSADLTVTADRIAALIDEYRPDAVAIDQGMGAGVIDMLKRRHYRGIYEVAFGSSPDDPQWANCITELYARCREWLRGGCIDDDPLLFADLTAREFGFWGKAKDRIILASKDEFRSATGRSPDDGDALALTFKPKVARRDLYAGRGRGSRTPVARDVDYPLFG